MIIPLVDLVAQYQAIRPEIDHAIAEVIGGGKFIGGKQIESFASEFASFCEAPYCVPCANGTDAIEIALASLGIGHGDEVIIPALTFAATFEAVCNAGATPVLCDIDPQSFTIDTQQAISLVTERTKAFIPVHLYGQVTDLDLLMAYASDHNMFVIEDAAQAHGALYKKQKAGSIGDINTFSFYPGKNLGAYGDAGAMTTKSEWLYTKAKKIANHGRISKYDHDIVGRNSRMDTLQAAILSIKLKHLPEWIKRKQSIADYYTKRLQHIEGLTLPAYRRDGSHVFHLYVVRVRKELRESFRSQMKEQGIETGIHYPVALSRMKVTTEQLKINVQCPEAEKASEEVVSIPMYAEMKDEMVEYVAEKIENFFCHDKSGE